MASLGIRGSGMVVRGLIDGGRLLRPRDLLRNGVSPAWIPIHQLLLIDRLDRGVYGALGRYFPRVAIANERISASWACLYSALWMHGLVAEEPAEAWLGIRHKAWKPTPGLVPTQIVRSSLQLVREDFWCENRWGVPTTTLARTVLDFYRMRHRVGVVAAFGAIRLVLASGKCSEEEIEACAGRHQRPAAGDTSHPL